MDRATKGFKRPAVRMACSYLFDWMLCIALIALFLLLDNVTPFKRQFSVEDRSLMYPYKEKEIIPTWALIVIAVVFPAVLMAAVSLFIRRSSYDLHNGILGLLLSVSLTIVVTQVVKVTVGKHRPDFIDRCKPMLNGVSITRDEPLKLWKVDVCTTTDHSVFKDGMRSFPSGHASTSFAGLTYLTLWLAGKMHVFDRKGYSLKSVILMIPILAAMLVTISRIEDDRHSAPDVGWGTFIGIFFAFFSYHQYYPAITRSHSHIPYPPRDFSYLVKDDDGGVHKAGHLEAMTGIHPNEESVDETQQQPEQLTDLESQQS
ncbi:hypothetical protein BGZ97_011560 [Linnemannia gamsii]|uniref:Phosphatidic acid phosphatase type 2/haloperoxidase domain-containing protein n=1 Tax=Linnemannia gamsii TaxID=64522 RepID=A0A9P6R3K0_9FUNG|nr:hypothetical protein BGZ97_011560 [Linnemannia gamsii]